MKGTYLITISCLISFCSFAQKDSSGADGKFLDEVIISSQRKAIKQLDIPHSTQVVSQTYFANYRPRTTPEALTGVNGVFIQKTNHGGGSPFLRGLTGNQTLILIDGIRLNNSTFRYGPNQYLNTIDAFTISKIEVAKGTGSVQYGSDALGGILQVFTKDPSFTDGKTRWSAEAVGKYMTGDMEKTVRGEASYTSKKAVAIIGATYRNFGDLIGGDSTGRQAPSGYKEFAFDAKTKWLLNGHTELTLAHQLLQQQHVPVYHKVVLENFAENEFHPQQRMLNYAKLHIKSESNLVSDVEMIASWQQTMEGRDSRKNQSLVLRKERDDINTVGFTTDIYSLFSKVWTANSGIELYADKVSSKREDINIQTAAKSALRGLYPDNSKYGNYSIYSLHHFALNKWILETGIRYNIFAINISDTTLGKVKITPSAFVYNASLLYKITATQSLYFTYNTGYRAPNVDDMGTLGIVDFRYEVPASGLTPERSRNVEVGYKLQTGKWSATFSGYYMHLDNIITRVKVAGQVVDGYAVYKKENVDDAYIKGLEGEITYQLLKGWQLSGNISYTYGESLSKNEPMRRIPPMNGRVMTSYRYKKLFAAAEVLFASKQDRLAQGDKDDNRIPKGGTPGYTLFNIFAGVELSQITLNVGLQNLSNEDYRTHGSGINGVGRSAWLSVAVKL